MKTIMEFRRTGWRISSWRDWYYLLSRGHVFLVHPLATRKCSLGVESASSFRDRRAALHDRLPMYKYRCCYILFQSLSHRGDAKRGAQAGVFTHATGMVLVLPINRFGCIVLHHFGRVVSICGVTVGHEHDLDLAFIVVLVTARLSCRISSADSRATSLAHSA